MDYIDTYIVKLIAPDILPAITHIVNLSIRDGVFPKVWKNAKVVPLLKKDDPLNPKNYRPVALLPVLSKILERAVFQQLVGYLDHNGILNPNHHGSRKVHSTASALIQMYDVWARAVDEGNMVGVMMVDLSAAFDMVDHDILLAKLELLGLDMHALQWVYSYLAGRAQCVCVDGQVSPLMDLKCGVPQGSVLGPLLYILFTNDLPDVIHTGDEHEELSYQEPNLHCRPCGGLVTYVDDATCTVVERDPVTLSSKLSERYKAIEDYMVKNKLVINADKTHLVVMGSKAVTRARQFVSMRAGEFLIHPSETEKLLGCNIHQSLKWKSHIQTGENSLIKNLTRKVNALQKVCIHASFKTRLAATNAVFMSTLTYLLPVWGGCESYLVKSIQTLQNKAARQVTRLSRYASVRRLLSQCNWLSIKQLIFYQSSLTVYRTVKSGVPLYLSKHLITNHPLDTRLGRSGSIRLTGKWGDVVEKSFLRRAAHYYNEIPRDIRESNTIDTFKKKVKTWIKTNIPYE